MSLKEPVVPSPRSEGKLSAQPDSAEKPLAPTVKTLVSRISEQIRNLIQGEIELTKVKVTAIIKGALVGIISLVVAAVLALYALGFLFASAASGLQAVGLSSWLALLIVGAVLLVVALILVVVAKVSFNRMPKELPNPKDNLKSTVDVIKEGWHNHA